MTAAMLEANGFELAFDERGQGVPLLLVHGELATRSLWASTRDALGEGHRTIAYDRRGYGESGAPEGYAGTTVEEQAEDAALLVERCEAAPAVLCGHSFGAVVCLDLLRRRPELVRAAVLIEPPLLELSSTGPEVTAELRARIERGAREGRAEGAAAAYREVVTGAAHDLAGVMPAPTSAATRALAADLGATPRWGLDWSELRAIDRSVTVVAGSRSRAVWREVCQALARRVRGAELRELAGGHFVPLEAPGQLAAEVERVAAASGT